MARHVRCRRIVGRSKLDPVICCHRSRTSAATDRWAMLGTYPNQAITPRAPNELLAQQVRQTGRLGPADFRSLFTTRSMSGRGSSWPSGRRSCPTSRRPRDQVRWAAARCPPMAMSTTTTWAWEALHREVPQAIARAQRRARGRIAWSMRSTRSSCFITTSMRRWRWLGRKIVSRDELGSVIGNLAAWALKRVGSRDARRPVTEPHLHMLFAGKLPGILGFDEPATLFVGGATTPARCRVLTPIGQRDLDQRRAMLRICRSRVAATRCRVGRRSVALGRGIGAASATGRRGAMPRSGRRIRRSIRGVT